MTPMVLITSEQFSDIVIEFLRRDVITATAVRRCLTPSGIRNSATLGTYQADHIFKYVFLSSVGKKICVKMHDSDIDARRKYGGNCNSASGWTMQVSIGHRLFGRNLVSGEVFTVRRANNETHIPIVWDGLGAETMFSDVTDSELGEAFFLWKNIIIK